MIDVRPAVRSDASALARLAERTFREAYAADNIAATLDLHCERSYGPEQQLREIEDPNLVTLLVESDGELVAFAQLRPRAPKAGVPEAAAELARLYVAQPWHGRGVAQELMTQVLQAASARGARHLWLGVWEKNGRAQAFYRKSGFSEYGEHICMVGDDPQRDLIMVRSLRG
jgi:ribosomal protein S18 acetylase RimI-like enzyme